MRFCYADPPYIGQAQKHYSHDPLCAEVDHAELLLELEHGGYDGWALSLSSPSLYQVQHTLETSLGLHQSNGDYRVMPWVKPFASFKANVTIAYAWEPVIVRGGRKRTRQQPTVRDWVSANITLKRGLSGVKPNAFYFWLFDVLNMQAGDELIDLYPGSGAVTDAWCLWREWHCDQPLQLLLEAQGK